MSSIIYTPDNSKDPRNHPHRIYVSCHEQDMARFAEIAALLREVVEDCVVAYRDPDAAVDAAHWEELSDFHLVVIPVTERWFADGIHRAELAFIAAHHMAVVPLLYDAALLDAFNACTQNWQCLALQDGEFAEKWRRALQGVLFDTAMTDEVRRAFTHRMFLAYCREDLEQTKALVRAIHGEEQGRRVAVWYDKYLPTGRNFEDSIFTELDACHIFGVTLTPQLLSRTNYVKTTEFPRAFKAKKRIVFFEAQPTGDRPFPDGWDGAEEQERVSVGKPAAFAAYVRRLLQDVKVSDDKAEPPSRDEVDYWLGLAYQHGIGVEFDHRYAVKKLESAAKAGHVDAAHALAEKYFYGNGVRRDVKQAVYWYRCEIRLSGQKALKDIAFYKTLPVLKNGETGEILGGEASPVYAVKKKIDTLADNVVGRAWRSTRVLIDEGYYPEAEQIFGDALKALKSFDDVANQCAIGTRYSGKIYMELTLLWLMLDRADPQRFAEVWRAVLAAYEEYPDDVRAEAVKIGRNYGFFLLQRRETEQARAVMERALTIAEEDRGESKSIYEVTMLLYRDLGRSYLTNDESDPEARRQNATCALDSLARYRAHLERYPFAMDKNPYLYAERVWTRLHAADAYRYAGDAAQAATFYAKALTEIGAVETQLADCVETKDFAVVFLQLYVHALEGLCAYGYGETLQPLIEKVVARYSAIRYPGALEAQARGYLSRLSALLAAE